MKNCVKTGLAHHLLGALVRGVSTREYAEVLPQMAETEGVSRSAISRQAIEASVEQLQQCQERRWEGVEILVMYIDGQRFAEHHVISAVGVDAEGQKHILGIEPGATENAAAVKRLLTRLREHGLPTDRQYLFVIDGAKALRAAIEAVFGTEQPVQRCSALRGRPGGAVPMETSVDLYAEAEAVPGAVAGD